MSQYESALTEQESALLQFVDLSKSRLSGAIDNFPKDEFDFDPDWEIDPRDLIIMDKLGAPGAYCGRSPTVDRNGLSSAQRLAYLETNDDDDDDDEVMPVEYSDHHTTCQWHSSGFHAEEVLRHTDDDDDEVMPVEYSEHHTTCQWHSSGFHAEEVLRHTAGVQEKESLALCTRRSGITPWWLPRSLKTPAPSHWVTSDRSWMC